MRRHRPYPRNLVRRDRNAQTRTADQQSAVAFPGEDQAAGGDGDVRVGCFVGAEGDADVVDGGDEGAGGEVGFESFFVGEAGVVAADGDAEGWELGGHGFRESWFRGRDDLGRVEAGSGPLEEVMGILTWRRWGWMGKVGLGGGRSAEL